MTIAADNSRQGASHLYRTMRDVVQSMGDAVPGKFEITKEGIVHDMMSPGGRTRSRPRTSAAVWKR